MDTAPLASGSAEESGRELRRAPKGVRAFVRVLSRVGHDALDVVYPPRCWLCGRGTLGDSTCEDHRFPAGLRGPRCGRCALPLAPALPHGMRCPACRAASPGWREIQCAGDYDSLRPWVLALKHGRRRDVAPLLGTLLAQVLERRPGGLPRGVLLVPVPTHPLRRLARGIDPAGLLGRELSDATDLELTRCLRRVRATAPQGTSGPSREANVRAAFRVLDASPAGREVWLVDDVVTSGATARACARVLRRAGARSVSLVVLARAGPGPREPTE